MTTTHLIPGDTEAGVVFASASSGHRGPYVALLASLFGMASLCAAPAWPVLWRLIRSPRVLLATIDDNIFLCSLMALVRGLLGKPTVGLFLRPQHCFDTTRLKNRLKKLAIKTIRRIPHLTLITITPFSCEQRYSEVAHFGVHDPQYWDLHDGGQVRTPRPTTLSKDLLRRAAGRRILGVPGSLVLARGFGFLADILQRDPSICERMLVVAAGKLLPDAREASRVFVEAGGVLIDRMLEDAEIESLYTVSDIVWACYAPEYDQASGIFGRAVQLGVPVIVRRGSLIERFASGLSSPILALEFADVAQGVMLLSRNPPARLSGAELDQHSRLIGSWREDFVRTVEQALRPDSPPSAGLGKPRKVSERC